MRPRVVRAFAASTVAAALIAFGAIGVNASLRPRSQDALPASAPVKSATAWYDARQGAAGYSPIIGTFGALSIPAIFLLLDQGVVGKLGSVVTVFAIGMLIVSLLGTMFGAIGLAAIAAETEPTANLAPAIMSISVSTTIGLATLFGGVALVASKFVPEADWLFWPSLRSLALRVPS